MIAIVNGKRYDTTTATQIHEVEGHVKDRALPGFWREVLYSTPKGALFLWGEGGEGSKWFRRAKPEDRRTQNLTVRELVRVPYDQAGGARGVVEYRRNPRAVSFGQGIEALTEDKAKAWVERYCAASVYERLWGDEIEDA